MHRRKKEAEQTLKLLLLGAGESGKSTLFKQTISLYGSGFSNEDLQGYTHIVYNNTISGMKTLIEEGRALLKIYNDRRYEFSPNAERSAVTIEQLDLATEIDREVAEHIQILWQDPGIQFAFANRAKFQLSDGVNYFFDNIATIGSQGYTPTEEDILRCRVRTTGIVETSFLIDGVTFKLFDVGGQRNERRKWIHCFESVTAVIFVAAMSEYDQALFEDDTINRMHEALSLFEEIVNSKWFRSTSIILFLNKSDLLEEKIKQVSLKVTFPDYTGPDGDFEPASQFIRKKFEEQNRTKNAVYPHITCATNKQNVRHVFNASMDIILRQSLRDVGLLQ